MGYPTDRIQLYDKDMNPLPELHPHEVESRVRHEEINGEHTLTLVTTRRLEVGWRALTVDGTGKWREWVVEQPDELHDSGECATGTYRMVWSLQYDLSHTYDDSGDLGHKEVGIASIGHASKAAECAIAGSKRWTVGTCDADPIEEGKGVVMIAESAWDRLSKVVEAWDCEVDAIINVSVDTVASRQVVLMKHLGTTEPTRRFEWADDLTSIRRTPDPGPYFCRVVPIGKGQNEYAEGPGETIDDEISFEWPLSLLDDPEYFPTFPDGSPLTEYIQDDEAALNFRVSDGKGGWEYPTVIVKYNQDDVELLYNEAIEDLYNHTRPNVTYEASVVQLAKAGMDAKGVELGDEIQCVDRGFNPDAGLTIQERVTVIDVDELDDERTELTIGEAKETLSSIIGSISRDIGSTNNEIWYMSTAAYMAELLNRLNNEINATGGYAYLVKGKGLLTYDVEVSDPAVGAEASQVVEVKGGSIRIANSRTSSGDWDWKSVFVSGHILAELITAVKIVAGYIGSPNGDFYINLDTHEYHLGALVDLNGKTVETVLGDIDQNAEDITALDTSLDQDGVFNRLTNNGQTQGLYLENKKLYVNASYIKTGTLSANLIKTGTLLVQKNGKTMLSANCDTGEVSVDADAISLQAGSLSAVVSSMQSTYGTCYTGQSTQTKVVTIASFLPYVGFTVTVTFSYANTAANPILKVQNTGGAKYSQGQILVNGSNMAKHDYWTAGAVLTFVWDGSHWRVADGFTMSKIKVLKDSITLSVSGGLGSNASIVLSVDGTQTTSSMNLKNVRSAFANDKSAITISAGTVTFNSNTFVVNSTYFKVSSEGKITATSGTIGGFTIESTKLYNSKSTRDSLDAGVYIGTDGISTGSGSTYTAFANGMIWGGNVAGTTHGDIYFHNPFSTGAGTRIGGRGGMALMVGGLGLCVGTWGTTNLWFGQSKTVSFARSVSGTFVTDCSLHVEHPWNGVPIWLITGFDENNWSISSVYRWDSGFLNDARLDKSRDSVSSSSGSIEFKHGLMITS